MRNRRRTLAVLGFLACAEVARAQLLTAFFPEGVPGYGTEPGVTVKSRARPAFDPLGIQVDTATIKPLLGMSFGYDDNVFAGAIRRGAWQVATDPSLLISAERSTGGVGAYFSIDDTRYVGEPSQNRTDGSAFLGTTIRIGRDALTLGVGYLARHEDRTALDALPSDRPVAYTVLNARASYDAAFGRFTVTPSIELNRWRFENTTVLGAPVSEAARDRTTARLGVTLRYSWMTGRDLLVVGRLLNTHYDDAAVGAVSNNSNAWQGLVGIDYDEDTVWRIRLLGGLEYRQAAAASIGAQTTPIAEAEITWLPSGMTTVRATVSRGVEDAAQTGLSTYTYTSGQLSIDHETRRDLLLSAAATVRQASFNQTGGQQTGVDVGLGGTWLINREARLSLTYDFTDVWSSHLPAGTVAGDFTRGLAMLTLRVGL